ncbi:hypothetical protein [Roseimaritima sediminicola]|uniref:hypothetical protein n=1 Tax=Roseimaritima sediminicola TaxID=2662066 RepID=UPI0013872CF9|nr:hypothetical protein [Roseimaritima sediminicola]
MTAENTHNIIMLDDCSRAIAEAERLDELTDLRSRAEAIRTWAKSANQSLEVQNRAATLRLMAERKAGKLLSQLRLRGGDRKSNGHDDRLKLSDLGITQNQSKRWQREATVSDRQFADYVRAASVLGAEITAAGLLRVAAGGKGKKAKARRGKAAKPPRDIQAGAPGDAIVDDPAGADEVTQDAINHVQMLQQILHPYASGKSGSLSNTQRRAVLYFLSEALSALRQSSLRRAE